jgi:hypothetical protein
MQKEYGGISPNLLFGTQMFNLAVLKGLSQSLIIDMDARRIAVFSVKTRSNISFGFVICNVSDSKMYLYSSGNCQNDKRKIPDYIDISQFKLLKEKGTLQYIDSKDEPQENTKSQEKVENQFFLEFKNNFK